MAPIRVGFSEFYLTDGTTRVNFLSLNNTGAGIGVDSVKFQRPQRDTDSIFAQKYKAVDETYRIKIAAPTQDQVIAYQRNLEKLLIQAYNFFNTDTELKIVWLVSRASREKSPRYAVVLGGYIQEYADIYGEPFVGSGQYSIMNDLDLGISRGAWLANPPSSPISKTIYGAVGSLATSKVYIDNRFTEQLISSIKHFKAVGSVYTTVSPIAYPAGANLFPTTPAVGDILYIGFPLFTTLPASRPSTIYFNIITAAVGMTLGPWQFYNFGAGAYQDIPYQYDSTAGLTVSGAIAFPQIDLIPWAQSVVNGVTLCWMRVTVTAIPGGTHTPPKANLVYQPKNYFEVTNISGDIPSLLDITMYNRAYTNIRNDIRSNFTSRITLGVRSTDRGATFMPWLIPEAPNPVPSVGVLDLTLIKPADTPTQTFAWCQPGNAWESFAAYKTYNRVIDGLTSVSKDYYGTYRAFLRVYFEDTPNLLSMRLVKKIDTAAGSSVTTYGPEIFPTSLAGFGYSTPAAYDMGQVVIGQRDVISTTEMGGNIWFEVQLKSNPPKIIYLFELMLMPIDEWVGTFSDVNFVFDNQGHNFYQLQSAGFHKRQVRSVVKLTGGAGNIIDNWRSSTNGPIVLAPGKTQRIYALTETWNSKYMMCSFTQPHEVQVSIHERYVGMRGNG